MAETEPDSVPIGQKIREARLMRGLTQTDLAADFVTPSMISQIEAGRTRPSNALLAVIADRLEVPLEHFTGAPLSQIQAGVRVAMLQFWLLLGRAEPALDVLRTIPEPTSQPALREYQLLKARTLRLTAQTESAEKLLASLLADAIRRQDDWLLWKVYKESGYVEYAMNRPSSARHEWTKALNIGESVANLPEFASVPFHAEMAEVCLRLRDASLMEGDNEEAAAALRMAERWSQSTETVQSMAMTAMSHVEQALEAGEVTLAERAMQDVITVLTWTSIAVQRAQIEASLDRSSGRDPWSKLASSLATANPAAFLAAEGERIAALIAASDYASASVRISRAQCIADDYCHESAVFVNALRTERMQLGRLMAECEWNQGQQEDAIARLTQLSAEAKNAGEKAEYLESAALLLKYYIDAGDIAHAMENSAALEKYLMTVR